VQDLCADSVGGRGKLWIRFYFSSGVDREVSDALGEQLPLAVGQQRGDGDRGRASEAWRLRARSCDARDGGRDARHRGQRRVAEIGIC